MDWISKIWLGLMVFHFQQYFSYIVAVSFIGGGNRIKIPTCCKSLKSLMLYTLPWSGFELTTSVVIGTDCMSSCKSNYHTITAMTAPPDEYWWFSKLIINYKRICFLTLFVIWGKNNSMNLLLEEGTWCSRKYYRI